MSRAFQLEVVFVAYSTIFFSARWEKILVPVMFEKCATPLIMKIDSVIDFTKTLINDWAWKRLCDTLSGVMISMT